MARDIPTVVCVALASFATVSGESCRKEDDAPHSLGMFDVTFPQDVFGGLSLLQTEVRLKTMSKHAPLASRITAPAATLATSRSPVSLVELLLDTKQASTLQVTQSLGFVEGDIHLPLMIYVLCMFAMLLTAAVLYWSYHWVCILRIQAYLIALSTMQLVVKALYMHTGFTFPRFLSFAHFAVTGIVSFIVVGYRGNGKSNDFPTRKQFYYKVLPISVFFASSIAVNNLALTYTSASFVVMIGNCTPLCIFFVMVCIERELDDRFLWPVLLASGGMVGMCSTGEHQFSSMGFALAVYALFARSIKCSLQQNLMDDASLPGEPVPDPIQLTACMCAPSAIFMLAWSLFSEGAAPFHYIASSNLPIFFCLFGLSCFNACILNVVNMYVIKDLGALGSNLAGSLQGFLKLLGAVALLDERIKAVQLVGFGITLMAVNWHNALVKERKHERMGLRTEQVRQEAEQAR